MQKPQRNTKKITGRGKGEIQTSLYSLRTPLRPLWFLYLLFLSFCISSCEKEPSNNQPNNVGKGVYITNEGNFQFGNARVSYYNKDDGSVTDDLFQPANNRPLGDILQSMYIFNGKAYLVVNNSHKIEVVDPTTFVSLAAIAGLGSPRYFLPVDNSKAYVTDFETVNAISIIDLNNNTATGTIPLRGWTEELILASGKVFVTNLRSDKIYVVNPIMDVLEDSITVSYASVSIVEDKNGKLWALCSGDEQKFFYGGLHRINPATMQVEQSFQFPNLSERPWRLKTNPTADTLYFLNEGVFRMSISETALPATAFIPENNRNFYGLGVDPETNTIYVSDAIDFVQRGVIYRYQPDGTFLNSFYAGIIPGEFWFD